MAEKTQKTLIDITALKYFYKSLQNVTVLIAPSSIESASSQNLGRTYFIPADGTYAGLSCKKGDHIVSNGTTWVLIPKGTSEGTSDYSSLTNKPQINGHTLTGNKSSESLGLLSAKSAGERGADYNYFTSTGFYEAIGDAQYPTTNAPDGKNTDNNFVVIVQSKNPSYLTQTAFSLKEDAPIYHRVRNNGTWGYWRKIAKISDLPTISANKSDITIAGTKVPNANAVYGFVDDAIKALDVTDSAVTGKYVSAVSEADGKITVTRADLPTSLPASDVTDEYSAIGEVPVSGKAVASAISGKLDANQKGTAGGVAELDANGKVLSSQLPSYVDDVVEASSKSAFPTTGESGKIYVDTTANLTYRWTGTAYTEISPSIALGETASTAFRGDHGKTAYDHATTTATNPHNTTKSDVGLGNVGNFKAVSTVASQGLTDTEKSNARTNIGAGTVTKVKVGSSGTEYSPTSGVVTIPAYPTSLPANGGTAANVSGTVAVANGGTGATTAANARTNLGLGAVAVKGVETTITATDNNVPTSNAVKKELDKKVDETELSSFKEEMYEQTGGKNMLGGSLVNKTGSQSGCSFVYNEMTSKLTINGTATVTPTLVEFIKLKTFKAGSYTLSIHDINNAPEKMIITIRDSGNATKLCNDITPTSTSTTFTLTSDTVINMSVRGETSVTYDNTSCYIMLRKADTDDTFVPYMPTNQELQTNILSTIVASSNASANNSKTIEFQGTGKNLEKLVVEGKTSQDGTPSPSAPVEVKGVGDKSRNLFVLTTSTGYNGVTITNDKTTGTVTFGGTNGSSGASFPWSDNLKLEAGTYILMPNANKNFTIQIFKNSAYYSNHSNVGSTLEITLTESATYSFRPYFNANTAPNLTTKPMLVKKGVATDFEPYYEGYKIPISVGGTTKNVYLNAPLFDNEKVDVVSGVFDKKYVIKVLDGSENWYMNNQDTNELSTIKRYSFILSGTKPNAYALSSHFQSLNAWGWNSSGKQGVTRIESSGVVDFKVLASLANTVTQWKAWLAEQYAAGTPVTYMTSLTTSTKETFDAPEIATTVGKNTLSINTDVAPTKIEATSFGEYYSKAEVDKMLSNYETKDISIRDGNPDQYFSEFTVFQKYNKALNQVVVYMRATTKATIPANQIINVGTTDGNLIPKTYISDLAYASNNAYPKVVKNSNNNAVSLVNDGADIPANTNIYFSMSWNIF